MSTEPPDKSLDALGSKVDALLKRHASGTEDRNIPVLSEIVRAPDWKPVTPVALPRGISDEEARKLAAEIFDRVFARVEQELTTRFEERLTERMAAQISVTIGHVLSDLSPDIANVIGDAINEALLNPPSQHPPK
ncbi:MAG: hypothetical protein SF172_13990 [Burkholderiales bacterium]|nr:hypothetical protein [Burkholderiales bacterium]